MNQSIKSTSEFYSCLKDILDKRTLQELSELTGIDKSNLSKIINGKSNPSLDTVFRILGPINYHVEIVHHSDVRKIRISNNE